LSVLLKMKEIKKFNFRLLFFVICFSMTFAFISCRIASSEVLLQANAKENLIEEIPTPDDNEDDCLTADYPKREKMISLGVLNAKAIDIPKPEYPDEAKDNKIDGEVTASIVVDETGKVAWAKVDNGHQLLQEAVKKVVCKATFKPATVSRNPISFNGIIKYKFVLP
jgi:TonB family protein